MLGKRLAESAFISEPGVVYINHGSYGRVPNAVFEHQVE
jgi:hypothetical protein